MQQTTRKFTGRAWIRVRAWRVFIGILPTCNDEAMNISNEQITEQMITQKDHARSKKTCNDTCYVQIMMQPSFSYCSFSDPARSGGCVGQVRQWTATIHVAGSQCKNPSSQSWGSGKANLSSQARRPGEAKKEPCLKGRSNPKHSLACPPSSTLQTSSGNHRKLSSSMPRVRLNVACK